MSIWIRSVCRKSVVATTPEELRSGIAKRLKLLTYLYGEDDYEETVARLRVRNASAGATFEVYRLSYHQSDQKFIRAERWSKPKIVEELKELIEVLEGRKDQGAEMIRQLLAEAIEVVAFELKQSDADGMGWPVAIAAAAYLAEKGDGAVHAEGEGWMGPTETEIEVLLDE